jgi:sigma-E factor negative regulatory protein RseC
MIEERAVVVDVAQDMAMLEIVRRNPCGLCGQTQGCGISAWGRLLGHKNNVFRAGNQLNAQVGDHVVVGLDEKAFLASSLAMYGVPLALLLTGAVIGMLLGAANSDLSPLIGAGLGLAVGLLWLRGHAMGRGMDARYRPVILRSAEDHSQIRICHRGN